MWWILQSLVLVSDLDDLRDGTLGGGHKHQNLEILLGNVQNGGAGTRLRIDHMTATEGCEVQIDVTLPCQLSVSWPHGADPFPDLVKKAYIFLRVRLILPPIFLNRISQ